MSHHKHPKILFLLKRRHDYNKDKHAHSGMSTGLFNSASFMNDMLNDAGIKSEISVVVDNNCIDREVTKHKPTHVIIEALWVVPSKFTVLCSLHPKVKWIVRLHSEIPFLANEGMAMDWLGDYSDFKNLVIAGNSPKAVDDIRAYISTKKRITKKEVKDRVIYLPNFYPQDLKKKDFNKDKHIIDIACFGAIRPLKNHVVQALAAIKFAESIGKRLRFHINGDRVEQKGGPILHNLEGMFMQLSSAGHELINHEWAPREEFLKTCGKMDIGMQVSFSETFNIVGADIVSQGVPLVASSEIPWANRIFCGKPEDINTIFRALWLTYMFPKINTYTNQMFLNNYTNNTRSIWVTYFKK
jgi:hypothetical protein